MSSTIHDTETMFANSSSDLSLFNRANLLIKVAFLIFGKESNSAAADLDVHAFVTHRKFWEWVGVQELKILEIKLTSDYHKVIESRSTILHTMYDPVDFALY